MNVYHCLNKITKYIDENLEEKIDYAVLAQMLDTNIFTLQKLFTILTGLTLSDYLRKRKLSRAGYDLYRGNFKIIDIALKYGYNNATSFSRAFEKFHGIKPSEVTKKTKLKNFPTLTFNEQVEPTLELDYEIIELEKLELYGVSTTTNTENISADAPRFFSKTEKRYAKIHGDIKYGMISYDEKRETPEKYYCLFDHEIKNFERVTIPKSKWLKFRINSRNAKDIQDMSHKFYFEFLPSVKYDLKDLPELEYYHDNLTDFLIAIE